MVNKDAGYLWWNIVDEMCTFEVPGQFSNVVGWELMGIELPIGERGNFGGGAYRKRGLVFILKRHWKFYIYRVIVVMFIVGMITLALFTFGKESAAARFGFISTMLLTVVAYMFIIKEYLPLLNYLTLLDIYVYFVLSFILIISVECFVTSFTVFGNLDREDIDYLLFVIDLGIWIIVHIIFIFWARKMNTEELKKVSTPKFELDHEDEISDLRINEMNNKYDKKHRYKLEGCEYDSISYFTWIKKSQ